MRHIRRKLESSSETSPSGPSHPTRPGSNGSSSSLNQSDNLVLLIRMKERDQSVISRLVVETETACLGDQILKSEEYIEAISVSQISDPDLNIELQHGSSWLDVRIELR